MRALVFPQFLQILAFFIATMFTLYVSISGKLHFTEEIAEVETRPFETCGFAMTTHPNSMPYMRGFMESLQENGVQFDLFDNPTPNFVLEGVMRMKRETFRFCLETQDSTDLVDPACLMRADFYFKTARSSEWISSRSENLPLYHRLVPIPLYRPSKMLNEKEYPAKQSVLFSAGTTLTGEERHTLYVSLIELAKNDSSKVDFHIRGGNIIESQVGKSMNMGDFVQYQKFLRGAYFMLNVQGIGGSQPFRLVDACSIDTPTVSEHILVDAYKSFPRYQISSHTHWKGLPLKKYPENGMNRTALKLEMEYLFERYKDLSEEILQGQRKWCKRLTPEMYAHHILAFIPGQPFKKKAFEKDMETAEILYGFADKWRENMTRSSLLNMENSHFAANSKQCCKRRGKHLVCGGKTSSPASMNLMWRGPRLHNSKS